MAHELEQDNATFRLDKDNPTHEDAEAIILKDTMNMADWQTLGISDLEPFGMLSLAQTLPAPLTPWSHYCKGKTPV